VRSENTYQAKEKGVCRFFQQGRCFQGDCCRFEHPNALLTLTHVPTIPATANVQSVVSSVVEKPLAKFIRSHPKKFQFCSTPDCDRFYRTSQENDAVVFSCDHCLTSIRTACNSAAHGQVTCDEAKAGRDSSDEFEQWKSNNDVRDCPSCAAPIQKSEGCDHMTCKS
jgi:hypothetical protein